jgi:hypothetical protein
VGLRRGIPDPAFLVPDEETSLVFGGDGAWLAVEEAARARVLVAPRQVPHTLAPALRSAWDAMPADRALRTFDMGVAGADAERVVADPPEVPEGDGGGEDEDHGAHDHGDMMAITGEPSADGLVMETMDVRAGPLGIALPGGLLVEARLDGDVVCECEVGATLRRGRRAAPDPWSAAAWAAADHGAHEPASGPVPARDRLARVAAVEVERAVSHLAWLHRFCRLLGWRRLTERVRTGLGAAAAARRLAGAEASGTELARTARLAAGLADALATSTAFARRTEGLGRLTADAARMRGLTGPVARASAIASDARSGDAGYARLGFEPVVRREGDARARALVRAAEAAMSLRLAAAAVDAAGGGDAGAVPSFGRPGCGVAESPRGPVRVLLGPDGAPERDAPGAEAARRAAGELAAGREWAAALVTIASFDLSPWTVVP